MNEKKVDPAMFEYEMTQVILQFKNEFDSERMSVDKDELKRIYEATDISLEWSEKSPEVDFETIVLPWFPEKMTSVDVTSSFDSSSIHLTTANIVINIENNEIKLPATPVLNFEVNNIPNHADIKVKIGLTNASPNVEKLKSAPVKMPDITIQGKQIESFIPPANREINLNWGEVKHSLVSPHMPMILLKQIDSAAQLPATTINLRSYNFIQPKMDYSFTTIKNVEVSPLHEISVKVGGIAMQNLQIPKHSQVNIIDMENFDATNDLPSINYKIKIDSYNDAVVSQCPAHTTINVMKHDELNDFSYSNPVQSPAHFDTGMLDDVCKILFEECENLMAEDWIV